MNLYLSSYRLGNRPELFAGMAGENKKTAVIVNAMDSVDKDTRRRGIERELADMVSLGLEPEELDLRDYFGKPEAMPEILGAFGVAWARGGNAFLLRKAMLKSGFDVALLKRIYSDPSFVYGGYSAGIVVLSPSLEGLELVDDVHAKASRYDPLPVWRGLGILDYAFAPHFESDHPESAAIDKVVAYYKEYDIPYKTLRDGEAIIIRGDEETFVT